MVLRTKERKEAERIARDHHLVSFTCPACYGRGVSRSRNINAPGGYTVSDPCANCDGCRRIWAMPGSTRPAWSDRDLASGKWPGWAEG